MTKTHPIFLKGANPEQKRKIVDFFAGTDITPNIIDSEGEAAVIICWPDDRRECLEGNLYAGGFSTCATAFTMAAKLGIERNVFGELLNALDVKLKHCQFGCF